MKKSLIFVGMLAIGYANAQEGNVGINTDQPKATLDIQPNADNAKAESKTNQGIIAPRLSKIRVANIETPVEGTLVYVTDETTSPISAYTGADAKVAKITEKGYYFYNGTEWVKTSATDGGEWVHNGTDAIYAKRAKDATKSNLFEILDNGRTYTNQGNVDWRDVSFNTDGLPSISQDPRGSSANLTMMSSAILPLNDISINKTSPDISGYNFMGNSAYVYQAHAGTAEGARKSYSTGNSSIEFKDTSANIFYAHSLAGSSLIRKEVSSPFEHLRGTNSSARHLGSGVVTNLIGANTEAYAEGTGNVVNAIGVRGIGYVRKEGKASGVFGGDFQAHIRDNASQVNIMYGVNSTLQALDTNTAKINVAGAGRFVVNANSPTEYGRIYGQSIGNNISENTTITGSVGGIDLVNSIKTSNNLPILNGVKTTNILLGSGEISKIYGYYAHLHNDVSGTKIPSSSNVGDYYAFYAANELLGGTSYTGTITNSYDFYAKQTTDPSVKIDNQYGLYILGAPKINYLQGNLGIGTNKPSEKLEVDGKIKTSSLAQTGAGDRVVYADENGVLKTGGSIAANNGVQTQTTMECNEDNRGKMNFGRISINSKETDAIGFCMKNGDNEFRWYYIYGGASHTVGTNANFGQGL